MVRLDCTDVVFGPRAYQENSGLTFVLAYWFRRAIIFILLGAVLHFWVSWVAYISYALGALCFRRFWQIRSWVPWRKHHYALEKLYMAAYARIAGEAIKNGNDYKEIRFEDVATTLLKSAFPMIERESVEKLIDRTNSSYWDVLVETGIVRKGLAPDELKEFKEKVDSAEKRQPDFVRKMLLLAMIIGAHDGPEIIPIYILARFSDKLPNMF